MKLDRRWVVIFLAGIVALISIGSSASVSLSGGCTSIIEGSDSVRGISTPDGTDITATGSIQAAINAAPPGATVSLLPKTYNEIVQVPKSIEIIGAGKGSTIVDGQQKGSVFTIPSGVTATLADMTIQNGNGSIIDVPRNAMGDEGPIIYYENASVGGGINNAGTLTVRDCAITGNKAGDSETQLAYGGGIYNNGTLAITDSTISGNNATTSPLVYGGGIWNSGTDTITNSIISGNTASAQFVFGGGIYSAGTETIKDSIISENNAEAFSELTSSDGGGIATGSNDKTTITGSTISGNSVAQYGKYHIGDVGGGGISNGGTLTVTDSIISENLAETDGGGGIFNKGILKVTDSTISKNTAVNGGGILNYGTGVMEGCNILGNIAKGGSGGGIYNEMDPYHESTGTLQVKNSTISGNQAGGNGGGIYWESLRPVIDPTTVITGNSEPQIYPY